MLLQQYLSKTPDKLEYVIENLTGQPIYWAVFRKKVVLMGSAPIERLSEPELVQPGETARIAKPDIKLPWKRYLVFSHDPTLLHHELKDTEFSKLLNIWVDEIGTVILTEVVARDGVRSVQVSSWTAWAAKKKMAPVTAKMSAANEVVWNEINGRMLKDKVPHAYAQQVARVRCSTQLSSEELQFNAMRSNVVKAGLQKLTGIDCSSLDETSVPHISICASGGGYRAMIATLGSLIGMEDTGILDTVTNISGLSGSTWTMASWYSNGLTLKQTRENLAAKLSLEFYTHKLWPHSVKEHVKERLGFDQELGLVDVMGFHLHHHLNTDLPVKEDLWNHPRLSEQGPRIMDGSKPMPIYTAISHEHKRYRWVEFTPFEIGMGQDINCYIPTWSFGRKFKDGQSIDFAIEPSLSLLQATWGSAFCATVDQMMHELETTDGSEPTFQRVLHSLIYDKLDLSEDRLITPAKFPNYALGVGHEDLKAHPWIAIKTLKLMDAGCHTNLPFTPLVRPERHTDLIIALDQSSAPDIYSSVSLEIMENFARAEKLPFPDCSEALKPSPNRPAPPTTPSSPTNASTTASATSSSTSSTSASPPPVVVVDKIKYSKANDQLCTIIKGDLSKGIPHIIYMPLLKNEAFSKEFCPRLNAVTKGGYCSTFNFKYTASQVNELSGLTEANIHAALETIRACIKEVTLERIALNKLKNLSIAK